MTWFVTSRPTMVSGQSCSSASASSTPVSTSRMARNSDTQASVPMSESNQQRVADKLRGFRLPAFAEHVGIEVLEAEADRVVGRIVVGPQHSNGRDRVHGGAIMSLADTLRAVGTILKLPPRAPPPTLE